MTILDVRNAEDFAGEPDKVPAAERMCHAGVGEWGGNFSKERLIVVYCRHGQRVSNLVLDELLAAGCEARRRRSDSTPTCTLRENFAKPGCRNDACLLPAGLFPPRIRVLLQFVGQHVPVTLLN